MFAPIGRAAEVLEERQSQSGTWITAAMEALLNNDDIRLSVATIASVKKQIYDLETRVTYYGITSIRQTHGTYPTKDEIECWKLVIEDCNPELIMVWGTECSNGFAVLEAAQNIPVMFYIQGVIGRNHLYPIGELKVRDLWRVVSPLTVLKFQHLRNNEKKQRKNIPIEKIMIKKSAGLIMDNDWEKSYYRIKCGVNNIYHWPLPIKKCFFSGKHNIKECDRHTVFSIDGRYPGKGLHQLIKAIAIVKEKYPDVKLVIPGNMSCRKPNIIFESPYYTYLKQLIKKNQLENNVVFSGQISSDGIRQHLLSCNVFVMPSCYESQSAALREAMYLGVPSISSNVGPIDEYTTYDQDVLTYRYGEIDALADHILRIFESDELAAKLGNHAYVNIRHHFPQDTLADELIKIYEDIISTHSRC